MTVTQDYNLSHVDADGAKRADDNHPVNVSGASGVERPELGNECLAGGAPLVAGDKVKCDGCCFLGRRSYTNQELFVLGRHGGFSVDKSASVAA